MYEELPSKKSTESSEVKHIPEMSNNPKIKKECYFPEKLWHSEIRSEWSLLLTGPGRIWLIQLKVVNYGIKGPTGGCRWCEPTVCLGVRVCRAAGSNWTVHWRVNPVHWMTLQEYLRYVKLDHTHPQGALTFYLLCIGCSNATVNVRIHFKTQEAAGLAHVEPALQFVPIQIQETCITLLSYTILIKAIQL